MQYPDMGGSRAGRRRLGLLGAAVRAHHWQGCLCRDEPRPGAALLRASDAPCNNRSGLCCSSSPPLTFGLSLLVSLSQVCGPLTCGVRAQVIHQVAILKRRLEFPADAPRALRALAERCMAIDPSQRSTFDQVKVELARLRAELPAPQKP